MTSKTWLAVIPLVLVCEAAAAGVTVEVKATGTVSWNYFFHSLWDVLEGSAVELTFRVESETFLDAGESRRAYVIDPGSFELVFETHTISLYGAPHGFVETPYFVIRDDDAGADGFFVSSDVDSVVGVYLAASGAYATPRSRLQVESDTDLLSSSSLLDALGSYDASDLDLFPWVLDDDIFEPMGINLETLTITALGGGWTDEGSALDGVAGPPRLAGLGDLSAGSSNALWLVDAAVAAPAALFVSLAAAPLPFKGGVLMPGAALPPVITATGPGGDVPLLFHMPPGLPAGTELWTQWAIADGSAVAGVALSNAVRGLTP